jgi:hypothetical protein
VQDNDRVGRASGGSRPDAAVALALIDKSAISAIKIGITAAPRTRRPSPN